jgi:hypothetical protein
MTSRTPSRHRRTVRTISRVRPGPTEQLTPLMIICPDPTSPRHSPTQQPPSCWFHNAEAAELLSGAAASLQSRQGHRCHRRDLPVRRMPQAIRYLVEKHGDGGKIGITVWRCARTPHMVSIGP